MPQKELVLPYAVCSQKRKDPFSGAMELAATMCIAETERRKGGSGERLVFASKQFYPIWVVPWGDRSILVDGMREASATLPLVRMPDIEDLIENLRRAASNREQYLHALKKQYATMTDSGKREKITVKGLILNAELVSDFGDMIKDAVPDSDTRLLDSALLLGINEAVAAEVASQIIKQHDKLSSEIKALASAEETVSGETANQLDRLREELRERSDGFDQQIASLRRAVSEKNHQSEIELKIKTEQLEAEEKEKTKPMLTEKNQLERELLGLQQNKHEFEKRTELRRLKRDSAGEARWKVKLQYTKKRISVTESRIRKIAQGVKKSERTTEEAVKKLRQTFQKTVAQGEKEIKNLEDVKDRKIKDLNAEAQEIQQESQGLNSVLRVMVDQVKSAASSMEEESMTWKIDTPVLVAIPYYALCFAKENRKSYVLRGPVEVQPNEGFMLKIRTAVSRFGLESRLSGLLKPRSRMIEILLESFKQKLERDKQAEDRLTELGVSSNLMVQAEFMKKLEKGFEELEKEGWVKPEEIVELQTDFMASRAGKTIKRTGNSKTRE